MDEQDVLEWRRVLRWRPGQVAKIKRRMRRRERREFYRMIEPWRYHCINSKEVDG